ncbi:hypothetical protein [Streptomyces sp. URMC 124]|uniref:hypothetical protein n=1 Tax=Streptomyces sp. URMC 124 TaxID=3423405 RepID=UPI003F1DC8AE
MVVLPELDQAEYEGAVLVRAAVEVRGARSDERGGHQRAVDLATEQPHAAELSLPVDLVVVVVLHRVEAEFEQLQMQVVRLGLGDAPVGAEQVFDQASFEGRLDGAQGGRAGFGARGVKDHAEADRGVGAGEVAMAMARERAIMA